MINTNKLKGRIKECGLTQADIAKELGIAQPTVNQKLNNLRPMDLDEAERLARVLSIQPSEFTDYFFTNIVA